MLKAKRKAHMDGAHRITVQNSAIVSGVVLATSNVDELEFGVGLIEPPKKIPVFQAHHAVSIIKKSHRSQITFLRIHGDRR